MSNHAVLVAAALLAVAAIRPADAQTTPTACVAANATVPPNANVTDPAKPFFIDTAGMDLRTSPPTRDPANPAYPRATELPDGALPDAGAEGNFIIGGTHRPAPETVARSETPHGTIHSFTLTDADGAIFTPGLIRDDPPGCRNGSIYAGHTVAGDPSDLLVPTSHPGAWSRTIDVYVPAQYVPGTAAPFLVFGDGGSTGSFPGRDLFTVLDNLIEAHRIPPIVAIGIAAGGQDAQGSERGREYDTVSGEYAEWIEREVLPRAEQAAQVRLTHNPDARATMGISSSGAAAFTMAWFHPELYRRVLAYSPTMVNQQWPHNPALRGGAWEYHSAWPGPATPALSVTVNTITPTTASPTAPLIPNSPAKPLRFWFEVGDHDLFYPAAILPDGMHDWVLADERMAAVLAAKGYHYQFLFARNAGHVDRPTVAQTLPAALEWLWKDASAP